MDAFYIMAGNVFVLQGQAALKDITGHELARDHVLQGMGWMDGHRPIVATGEDTWEVDLMPAPASA